MKKIYLLFFVFLLVGCSTLKKQKQITEKESSENSNSVLNKKIDSLYKLINDQKSIQEKKIDEKLKSSNEELEVRLKPKFDSLGNLIPVDYQRVVDGKIKESIKSVGGEIIYKTVNDSKDYSKNYSELNQKIDYLESALSSYKEDKESLKKRLYSLEHIKTKDKKVTDFSFTFYIVFGLFALLILVIGILYFYIRGKTKVLDKFKHLV